MRKESLSIEFIRDRLKEANCCCIVLINANELNGVNLDLGEAETDNDLLVDTYVNAAQVSRSSGSYQGHFIVLIGYDQQKQIFIYRNPSLPSGSEKVISITKYEYFERARKSYGTDEDILFIYL